MTRDERERQRRERLRDPSGQPEVKAFLAVFDDAARNDLVLSVWWRRWGDVTEIARRAFAANDDPARTLSPKWLAQGARYLRLLALGAEVAGSHGIRWDPARPRRALPPIPGAAKPRSVKWAVTLRLVQYVRGLPGANVVRGRLLPQDFEPWSQSQAAALAKRFGYGRSLVNEGLRPAMTDAEIRRIATLAGLRYEVFKKTCTDKVNPLEGLGWSVKAGDLYEEIENVLAFCWFGKPGSLFLSKLEAIAREHGFNLTRVPDGSSGPTKTT